MVGKTKMTPEKLRNVLSEKVIGIYDYLIDELKKLGWNGIPYRERDSSFHVQLLTKEGVEIIIEPGKPDKNSKDLPSDGISGLKCDIALPGFKNNPSLHNDGFKIAKQLNQRAGYFPKGKGKPLIDRGSLTTEETEEWASFRLTHLRDGEKKDFIGREGDKQDIEAMLWIVRKLVRSGVDNLTPPKNGGNMSFKSDKKSKMIDFEWSDQDIYDYFDRRGFFFPKEILTRYFLSLKTKPFVILTGISGTGKTKIGQIFAEYICQDETPEEQGKRIAFVPVRPDWMDNKGLLGYYNLLNEKYWTTQVLELLLAAEKNPDKPYFVILDELNLAKVEQYFSDFLSIMESRTSSNLQGEPLHLHSLGTVQSQAGLSIPHALNIPPNVYFTGTVNVDESTYMFSPKVLDRANVIEFNDVNLDGYARGFDQSERFILKDPKIKSELFKTGDNPFCSRDDYDRAGEIKGVDRAFFQRIVEILSPYGLHFGYRVINEVSRFIINASRMVKDFNFDDTMDIQMLQKILPKFHGTQAKLEEPLRKLLAACYRPPAVPDQSVDLPNVKEMMNNKDIRFPRSACKLFRMLKNMKLQGYTSFIE